MLKMLTESQMLKNLQQKSLNILWYKGKNRELDQIIRNNNLVNFLGHFLASELLSLLSFKCVELGRIYFLKIAQFLTVLVPCQMQELNIKVYVSLASKIPTALEIVGNFLRRKVEFLKC